MKLSAALFAVSFTLCASPLLADEIAGTVLAYDRVDNILVLTDKSVWELGKTEAPADLVRGDTILISFQSQGDAGVTKILGLEKLAADLPQVTKTKN